MFPFPAYVPRSNQKLITVLTQLGLTGNLKLCLDAGDGDSFTAGDKWLDRSGGGYDFHRGEDATTDGTEPTFNGTAGALSANEYFSVASKPDYFRYDSTVESWMDNLFHDNADWAFLCWYWPSSNTPTTTNVIFDTTGDVSGSNGVFSDFTGASGNRLRLLVQKTGATPLSVTADDVSLPLDQWHFVGARISEAGGAGASFFYRDGGYWQVSAADTFNGAYTAPGVGASNDTMHLLASGDQAFAAANGTRIAMLAMFEGGGLTKANFDAIYDATNRSFR